MGGLLTTVYKPAGDLANERKDTCVDITLNDWLITPPGSELQQNGFYPLAFLTLASHTNEEFSVYHLHVYFMPCSGKIKIDPQVTHFKNLVLQRPVVWLNEYGVKLSS